MRKTLGIMMSPETWPHHSLRIKRFRSGEMEEAILSRFKHRISPTQMAFTVIRKKGRTFHYMSLEGIYRDGWRIDGKM